MVRIISIAALMLGMVLFVGSFVGSPTSAMTSEGMSMDVRACDDCASSNMQMSDAACEKLCAVSGVMISAVLSGDAHPYGKSERFEGVTFDRLEQIPSPEPHPPK